MSYVGAYVAKYAGSYLGAIGVSGGGGGGGGGSGGSSYVGAYIGSYAGSYLGDISIPGSDPGPTTDADLEWTLPAPRNGVVSVPSADTNAQAALFYGEDIFLDVAYGATANYIITGAGDWQTCSGMVALMQSLLRRTITNPGEWKTKPNYGVGAKRYLKGKDTPTSRAELDARIRSQYTLDPRVERVDQVVIAKTVVDDVPILHINVQFTPRGQLRTDTPQRIDISIR